VGPAGEVAGKRGRSLEQQRREASHRGEERDATQQSGLDVGEGDEGRDDEDHEQRHEDEVVALALVLLGCQLLLLADERGLAVDGTGVAAGLCALVLGREVLVGHGGLLLIGRGSIDDWLAADGHGGAGAGLCIEVLLPRGGVLPVDGGQQVQSAQLAQRVEEDKARCGVGGVPRDRGPQAVLADEEFAAVAVV